MDRKFFFRLVLVVVLLAAGSLSCQLVNDISELRSVATEIEGLATEIDLEGISTEIDLESLSTEINLEGIATEVDLEAMATEIDLEALTTDVGEILTGTLDLEGLITDIPFLGENGPVATPNGFPVDIPVITAEASDMSGSPTSLAYTVDSTVKDVVDFYRREMGARGWVEAAGSTVTDETAALTFQLGNRTARLSIEEDFFLGVKVTIAVQ